MKPDPARGSDAAAAAPRGVGVAGGFRAYLHRMGAAYLILAISLSATLAVFLLMRHSVAARDRQRFNDLVARSLETFETHTAFALNYLKSVKGLFAGSDEVTSADLGTFLATSGVREDRAGLLDVGYALRVPASNEVSHVESMKERGFPYYGILGRSIEPAVSYPIIYWDNLKGGGVAPLGWNPASEAARWSAMTRAAAAGDPVSTEPLELLLQPPTNQVVRGILIYLPVYRHGAALSTDAERRDAIEAFVFGSLQPVGLWKDVVGEGEDAALAMQVRTGREAWPSNLLYSSVVDKGQGQAGPQARLSTTITMNGLGSAWRVDFQTRPAFEKDSKSLTPWLTLAGGLTLSLLLMGVAMAQGRARAALVEEKDRLAVTLRSISDGVITTDVSGRIVLLNKAAEELSGWKQEEAAGRPLKEVFRVSLEGSRLPCADVVEAALRCERVDDQGRGLVLATREGKEGLISRSAATIKDAGGRAIGVVLVFRDIAERRQLEAELLKSSKLESVGLLAGGIAHDFNNLLVAIIGNLSLAKLSVPAGSELLELIEEVEHASGRARDLTQQLLTFSKGGAPIKQAVSLRAILRSSVEFVLRGSNVACDLRLPEDLWAVDVDAGQIGQVFNNLVINAMHAMPEGGVVVIIARNERLVSQSGLPVAEGAWVRISVADHGMGIAPEHLPKVFDPYFTTKKHGSGLGLTSAYSIVRKHGGLITVDSTPGQGAVFHVLLPASTERVAIPEKEASPPMAVSTGARILVMDDESTVRIVLRAMLRKLGHEVEEAADGVAAIERFAEAKKAGRPFALVIMDLTVPGGMGGREAVKKIRGLDSGARAIVSSGYSNDPVMAEFRQYGFDGVIEKPYRIEQLARVLEATLRS